MRKILEINSDAKKFPRSPFAMTSDLSVATQHSDSREPPLTLGLPLPASQTRVSRRQASNYVAVAACTWKRTLCPYPP
jgi:hypothetical protein